MPLIDIAECATFSIGEGVIGRVAQSKEQRYIQNCTESLEFNVSLDQGSIVPSSLICTPILHEDNLIGVLNISSCLENDFDHWHLRFLPIYCHTLASIITNVRLIENLDGQVKRYIDDVKRANTAKTDKKNCELAKKNLALYQTGQRIRTRVNDTNEVQILSEQDRIKRIKRSEKNMQSYCVNNE